MMGADGADGGPRPNGPCGVPPLHPFLPQGPAGVRPLCPSFPRAMTLKSAVLKLGSEWGRLSARDTRAVTKKERPGEKTDKTRNMIEIKSESCR